MLLRPPRARRGRPGGRGACPACRAAAGNPAAWAVCRGWERHWGPSVRVGQDAGSFILELVSWWVRGAPLWLRPSGKHGAHGAAWTQARKPAPGVTHGVAVGSIGVGGQGTDRAPQSGCQGRVLKTRPLRAGQALPLRGLCSSSDPAHPHCAPGRAPPQNPGSTGLRRPQPPPRERQSVCLSPGDRPGEADCRTDRTHPRLDENRPGALKCWPWLGAGHLSLHAFPGSFFRRDDLSSACSEGNLTSLPSGVSWLPPQGGRTSLCGGASEWLTCLRLPAEWHSAWWVVLWVILFSMQSCPRRHSLTLQLAPWY